MKNNPNYKKNLKKLLEYVNLEDNTEGRAELERRLNKIPEISKRAILISWGLTQGSNISCPPYYNRLNRKLGVEGNSRDIYFRAMKELFDLNFAEILIDEERFNTNLAINLGFLAKEIIGKKYEVIKGTIIGEELIKVINTTLTERESKVIRMRRGLNGPDYQICTLEKVGAEFNVTNERVRQLESKAIRKLRDTSRILKFDTVAKAEFEAQQARIQIDMDPKESISMFNFSVRTYNCLMRYGVDTIEKLLELTEKTVWEIRFLGKNGVEEICKFREKLGKPLE